MGGNPPFFYEKYYSFYGRSSFSWNSCHLQTQSKKNEYFTNHAMGCMLLQECTDHVQELKTVSDLNKHDELADIDYSIVADEFNSLVRSLNKVGAKVFLADLRYFPVGHRGVYHTVR